MSLYLLNRCGIRDIPTSIFCRGGVEVDGVVGMTARGTLKNKLERASG